MSKHEVKQKQAQQRAEEKLQKKAEVKKQMAEEEEALAAYVPAPAECVKRRHEKRPRCSARPRPRRTARLSLERTQHCGVSVRGA